MNKRVISGILAVCLSASVLISGCNINININGPVREEQVKKQIEYSFATKEEGIEYLMANKEYYAGFSQIDLDYRMQKKNADMDEYQDFAKQQVLDFNEDEKNQIDELMAFIEDVIRENGYKLPKLEPVVFINTTMKEECGALAYTHGTKIFINMGHFVQYGDSDYARAIMAHELFHCITRSNTEFRKAMYKLIHFDVQEDDFVIPPSVKVKFISNPDVEHHNAYAAFTIDGKKTDCFAVFISEEPFEKEGDSFFTSMDTVLVPTDGSDIYYPADEVPDFYEVFGENTDYVIDPEECMADNFSFALAYGIEGPEGNGYKSPEIIEGIIDYLKQDHE